MRHWWRRWTWPRLGKCPALISDRWDSVKEYPKQKEKLEPLRKQLLDALVRSVEEKHLHAEVRGRTLLESRPIAERSYVSLSDLVVWLGVRGHEPAEAIGDLQETLQLDCECLAEEVAEDRARLRLPDVDAKALGLQSGKPFDESRSLRLQIIHLQQELKAREALGNQSKPLSMRRLRTALTVIEALCRKAGIDTSSRGAAAAIASATDEIGCPVSEDTTLSLLREIPDALESRSR